MQDSKSSTISPQQVFFRICIKLIGKFLTASQVVLLFGDISLKSMVSIPLGPFIFINLASSSKSALKVLPLIIVVVWFSEFFLKDIFVSKILFLFSSVILKEYS